MNNSRKLVPLAQAVTRHFTKTAVRRADDVVEVTSPTFKKLKEVQKKFGVDDGTPVYLKGGFFDKLLYQATWVVTLAGVGLSFEVYYKLIFKD